MGKVVSFKKPLTVRCDSCNIIKPEIQEKLSHRGIDYTGGNQAQVWIVYQSGWKRIEVVPFKNAKPQEGNPKKIFYHCPDCRNS